MKKSNGFDDDIAIIIHVSKFGKNMIDKESERKLYSAPDSIIMPIKDGHVTDIQYRFALYSMIIDQM